MAANDVTKVKERKARMENAMAFRRRMGSWVRVTVEGGSERAARRVESKIFKVRCATSKTGAAKRAMGFKLLCAVVSGSTGAMMMNGLCT